MKLGRHNQFWYYHNEVVKGDLLGLEQEDYDEQLKVMSGMPSGVQRPSQVLSRDQVSPIPLTYLNYAFK